MFLVLGQSVYLARQGEHLRVSQVGVLIIIAALLGAYGATVGLGRVRLGAGLLVFAAVGVAASAAWLAAFGGSVAMRLADTQTAVILGIATAPLFVAAAGLHMGHSTGALTR